MSTNVGQFCFPCYIDTCDVVYNGSFLCCHLLYLIIYLQSLVIKEISINMVLVLSQRQFPKDDFPSDNFQSSNFPKIRLGPLRRRRLQWGDERCGQDGLGAERCGQDRLGKLLLGKLHIWKNPLGKYQHLQLHHKINKLSQYFIHLTLEQFLSHFVENLK